MIVGGGLAAATAAESLRSEGFDGDVTVVTDEAHAPYQRPPLSKGYLAGKEGLDAVIVHPREWYAENGIDLRTETTVTRIDPAAHSAEFAGGTAATWDALLLATGSSPRRLPIEVHDQHGVDIRTSAQVERIIGSDRVTGVAVDGEVVPADLVLIGVGAVPNTGLAEASGIETNNGILTDASLRTSAPDVFAAGDVANAYHPVVQRHLRSEHWANALNAGPVAARAMLGQHVSFSAIPYFYTDQFDLGMELSGYPPLMADADLVIRGDREAREFIAFWVDHGRVVGGMNVNVWDVNETVQQLIRSAAPIDLAALADPGVALDSLVRD
jgi:NADPH-dependent 2,4-dienoyl-CoA reductase/sulfur reductase-like enzyme